MVLTTLALIMTMFVMSSRFESAYRDGVVPYSRHEISGEECLTRVLAPFRQFMAEQIERAGNQDDVWLFLDHRKIDPNSIQSYDDVPFSVLMPAFMISELKVAFTIGFQLFLPFLVIDLVVSAILVSVGMVMMTPVMITLPLKLLLFVLIDGWRLVATLLLLSFG